MGCLYGGRPALLEGLVLFSKILLLWSSLLKNFYAFISWGGGGVSESMGRRGCAILALEVVPKNLIFA